MDKCVLEFVLKWTATLIGYTVTHLLSSQQSDNP